MEKCIFHGLEEHSFCYFKYYKKYIASICEHYVIYGGTKSIVNNIRISVAALFFAFDVIYQSILRTICYWQLHCIICYYHFTLQVDLLLYLQFHLVNRKIQYILSQNGLIWKIYRYWEYFKEEKSVYNRSIESTLTDIEVLLIAAHVYM